MKTCGDQCQRSYGQDRDQGQVRLVRKVTLDQVRTNDVDVSQDGQDLPAVAVMHQRDATARRPQDVVRDAFDEGEDDDVGHR